MLVRKATCEPPLGDARHRFRPGRIAPFVLALRMLSLSVPVHVDADARRVLLGVRLPRDGDSTTTTSLRGRARSGTQRIVLWCASPDRRGEKRALDMRVAVIGPYGIFGNTLFRSNSEKQKQINLRTRNEMITDRPPVQPPHQESRRRLSNALKVEGRRHRESHGPRSCRRMEYRIVHCSG
ncbi:hypothetical protein EDB85DRAFT_221622 [Lactarius pseudohatsudake]|nr:hypothetical protein EDB85DRAFT_221622 [Lactarius pseudohatsudake]